MEHGRHGDDAEENFQDERYDDQRHDDEESLQDAKADGQHREAEDSFQETRHHVERSLNLLRQRQDEAYESQINTAIQVSLQEAQQVQANLDKNLEETLDRSRRDQELDNEKLYENILQLSLDEADSKHDERVRYDVEKAKADSARDFEQQQYMQSQQEIEKAKMESAREFEQQQAEHGNEEDFLRQVQMASIKSYAEELFDRNAQNKRQMVQIPKPVEAGPSRPPPYPLSEEDEDDDDTQPIAAAVPMPSLYPEPVANPRRGRFQAGLKDIETAFDKSSSYGQFQAQQDNENTASMATTLTEHPLSPGRAVRERWSRVELPRVSDRYSEATPAPARAQEAQNQHQTQQIHQDQPSPGGYNWTRPPSFGRSISPVSTITSTEAQRPVEEQERSRLYESHPASLIPGPSRAQWTFSNLDLADADDASTTTFKEQNHQP